MYVSLPFASPTRKQDNKHGQPHDTCTKTKKPQYTKGPSINDVSSEG